MVYRFIHPYTCHFHTYFLIFTLFLFFIIINIYILSYIDNKIFLNPKIENNGHILFLYHFYKCVLKT